MIKLNKKNFANKFLRATALMLLISAIVNLGGTFNVFAASAKKANFTGEQVFRGVNFGDGPVGELFPEVWKSPQMAQLIGDGEEGKAFKILRENIITEIKTTDPTFMDRYGRELQSGEHLRIQAILEESSQKISKAMQKNVSISEAEQKAKTYQDDLANSVNAFVVLVCIVLTDGSCFTINGVIQIRDLVVWQYRFPWVENDASKLSRENYVNSIAEKLATAE